MRLVFVIISTRPGCDYSDQPIPAFQYRSIHTCTANHNWESTEGVNFEFPALSLGASLGILAANVEKVALSSRDTITVGPMVSGRGRWYLLLSINRYNGGRLTTLIQISPVDGFDKGRSGFFSISLLFRAGKQWLIVGKQTNTARFQFQK